MSRDVRITDDEARELWRRAAELQAAAERAERGLRAALPAQREGMSLEQVSAAAEGAGIDPDFVRMALAERRLPDAGAMARGRHFRGWLRWTVGEERDALELTRHVAAPPARVAEALASVAASPAFLLRLEDTLGEDILRDAVLVYRIGGGDDTTTFHKHMDISDARVVLVSLRPEEGGTRIRVRAPLFRRGLNLAIQGVFAALPAAWGASAGASVAGSVAAAVGASTAALLGPILAGLTAGAILGGGGFKLMYDWGVGLGSTALHGLVQAVALEAEGRAPTIPAAARAALPQPAAPLALPEV